MRIDRSKLPSLDYHQHIQTFIGDSKRFIIKTKTRQKLVTIVLWKLNPICALKGQNIVPIWKRLMEQDTMHHHVFNGLVHMLSICAWSSNELQWINLLIWYQFNNLGFGHQGDMTYPRKVKGDCPWKWNRGELNKFWYFVHANESVVVPVLLPQKTTTTYLQRQIVLYTIESCNENLTL